MERPLDINSKSPHRNRPLLNPQTSKSWWFPVIHNHIFYWEGFKVSWIFELKCHVEMLQSEIIVFKLRSQETVENSFTLLSFRLEHRTRCRKNPQQGCFLSSKWISTYFNPHPSKGKYHDMGVSINGGSPIAGWVIMENPSINGWVGGTPISGNLHISNY